MIGGISRPCDFPPRSCLGKEWNVRAQIAVLSFGDMLVELSLRQKLGADEARVVRLAYRASYGEDGGMGRDTSMRGRFLLA